MQQKNVWEFRFQYCFLWYSKIWFQKFKAGNFNIEVESRSGLLAEVDCDKLKQIVYLDRIVSTRTIVLELDVCQKKK